MGQRGGGPRLPDGLKRDQQLRVNVRRQELADLKRVSDAWNISMGEAAWLVIHERISAWRRTEAKYGEEYRAELIGVCELLGFSFKTLLRARELELAEQRRPAREETAA